MRRLTYLLLIVILILSVCVGLGSSNTNKPDNYPKKTIELIVPGPAGAAMDVPCRFLNGILDLGQPVVVVNRAGASLTLGTSEAAKKPADGYTLLWCAMGPFSIQQFKLDLDYKIEDFRHIAQTTPRQPIVMVVAPNSPIKSLKDLEVKLKAGEDIFFSAANPGSLGHLAMEAFVKQVGAKSAVFVPFTGSSAGTAALLGGHIDVFADDLSNAITRANSGQYVPIAIFDSKRVEALPNVPTLKELGHADMVFGGNFWIAVHKDTPDEIVDYLKQQINIATQSEKYQKFLKEIVSMGMEVMPEEELTKIVNGYYEQFGPILEMLGMIQK